MAELILLEILALPAERSRGRHNPRVIKRKMSTFPTRARAAPAPAPPAPAPAPRQVFPYEDHIRMVAPAAAIVPAGAPGRAETDPPATTAGPRCPRRRTTRATGQHTIWHAHVRAWRASNLSRHAYCQVHSLALRTFNAWLARLRQGFRRTRKDRSQ
jgi:hypothetical protein